MGMNTPIDRTKNPMATINAAPAPALSPPHMAQMLLFREPWGRWFTGRKWRTLYDKNI